MTPTPAPISSLPASASGSSRSDVVNTSVDAVAAVTAPADDAATENHPAAAAGEEEAPSNAVNPAASSSKETATAATTDDCEAVSATDTDHDADRANVNANVNANANVNGAAPAYGVAIDDTTSSNEDTAARRRRSIALAAPSPNEESSNDAARTTDEMSSPRPDTATTTDDGAAAERDDECEPRQRRRPSSRDEKLILAEESGGGYRYRWTEEGGKATASGETASSASLLSSPPDAVDEGGKKEIGDEEESAAVAQRYLRKLREEDEKEDPTAVVDIDVAVDRTTCKCRRSGCLLLYCPCYGEGNACGEDCKCMNCKNPLGINPHSKRTGRGKKKEKKKRSERNEEAAAASSNSNEDSKTSSKTTPPPPPPFPSLLMLTVSPGRLGLTLAIVPEGGAKIKDIDPACTFRGRLDVGDRIVTIDGKAIETLGDLQVGKERARKFGIVKRASTSSATAQSGSRSGFDGERARGDAERTAAALRDAVDPRRQVFTYLKRLDANGRDRASEHNRENLLTELLQWDKKNDVNTTAKMGAIRYQVLCVPLKRRETVNRRELDNQCFHQYNKQTKVFDKFLQAWASYCDGTEEDAANMILFNLAKRFPQCYVKNFDMATKRHEKVAGPPPVELPPDFVSHDGTNDIRWNTRYAELVKYKEEKGDCKVYTKTDLGRWVSSQRSARASTAKNLSPKRIELLDQLGFLWSGLPEGWARPVPGGDPRQNRAIAARIVHPELTIRETLKLGGFEEEELNAVKDPKHTWRTGYVYYKDIVTKKIENYDTGRRSGARLQIEKLVNILRSDDPDRSTKVFGEERGRLLADFLEAAEGRRTQHSVVIDAEEGEHVRGAPRTGGGGGANKRRRNEEDNATLMVDGTLSYEDRRRPPPAGRGLYHAQDDHVAEQEGELPASFSSLAMPREFFQ